MNYEKDRKILADVDGVLLDWESAFDAWMQEKGFAKCEANITAYGMDLRYDITKARATELINIFNESAWMGFLKPLRDSVEVLDRLACEHWHIECITSLSTDHWAGELRRMNLERWFGKTVRRVVCLDTGADKDEILREYKNSHFWIEDKPENAIAGLNAGHKPILITHPHNKDFNHPDVVRVDNWQQIYNIIKTA